MRYELLVTYMVAQVYTACFAALPTSDQQILVALQCILTAT